MRGAVVERARARSDGAPSSMSIRLKILLKSTLVGGIAAPAAGAFLFFGYSLVESLPRDSSLLMSWKGLLQLVVACGYFMAYGIWYVGIYGVIAGFIIVWVALRRARRGWSLQPIMMRCALLGGVLGIVAAGVVACVFFYGTDSQFRPPTWLGDSLFWMPFGIPVGVMSGMLLPRFVQRELRVLSGV